MNWRKVLAWEQEPLATDVETFVPTDPIDIAIYAIPDESLRASKLYARLLGLPRDPTIGRWSANFSENTFGVVMLYARSREEAKLLMDYGNWEDVETTDSDNFEVDYDTLEFDGQG